MECEGEKCERYYSCLYFRSRYLTLDKKCGYNAELVDRIHQQELKNRELLLKEVEK